MMNLIFRNSELIHQLIIKCSKSKQSNFTKTAVDIFLNKDFPVQLNEVSFYHFRWIDYLQNQNKNHLILALNRDVNVISNKIKSPKAFFHLLDLLKSQKSTISNDFIITNVPKLFPQIKTCLPADFLCVLNGINGKNFFWNEEQKRYVFYGSIKPNFIIIVKEINKIECIIRLIKDFIESSIYISKQYISKILEKILKRYYAFIAKINIKYNDLSGEQLLSLLKSETIEEIKAAAIICNTVANKYGGYLYNSLEQISRHGDPFISKISTDMKIKCLEFIESLIKEWMTKGKVNDPYSEFFIKHNPNINLFSNWWEECYYLITNNVPVIINNDKVIKILNTGKSLNLLRELKNPFDIKTSIHLSFNEFVIKSSFEANQEILKLFKMNDLLIHAFEDIHSFVLFQRGDFTNTFMEIEIKDTFQRLSEIVQRFSDHLIQEIDFEISSNDLKLIYKANPPISIIFGTKELSTYKLVSSLLLKLKRTEFLLSHTKSKSKNASIVLFEMHTFILLIQDYLFIQVIKKNYDETLKKINESQSVNDIIDAHNNYLKILSRGCWTTQSSHLSMETLIKICSLINEFIKIQNNFQSILNEFHCLILEFHEKLIQQENDEKELNILLKSTFSNIF